MWMGTYLKLPSYVLSTGENFQDVLNTHKEKLIGDCIEKVWSGPIAPPQGASDQSPTAY
jgi:hypothetical protein